MSFDTVVIEVDVEVGQRTKYPILPVEQIEVRFDRNDQIAPEALAMREDFPLVPHLNLRPFEFPRSLCLFEEPYRELRSSLTAAKLVERIRTWLRLTARGELHAFNQHLEPLLFGTEGIIILPQALFGNVGDSRQLQPLSVKGYRDHRDRMVILAEKADAVASPNGDLRVVAIAIRCGSREHGLIRRSPSNLAELHAFLLESGQDLLGLLRQHLPEWKESSPGSPGALDAALVLVIAMPKTRVANGTVEEIEVWAFFTEACVREVGEAVGLWTMKGRDLATLVPVDTDKCGADAKLGLLNAVFHPSRDRFAYLNREVGAVNLSITAVGCGALGSRVVVNAVRGALGFWTLIDNDLLLPHNLARHEATGGIGMPKAKVIAAMVNQLFEEAPALAVPLVADVLEAGSNVEAALRSADLILDMSASVPVARYLALDVLGTKRRMSLFLNPTGTDLTLLAEDCARRVTLDALEMQYYRGLLYREELRGHLRPPSARVRVGLSCRDVSTRISNDLVTLHGAIATRALRVVIQEENAAIRIWRADEESLGVSVASIEVSNVHTVHLGDWTIKADDWLLRLLSRLRSDRLPNETGGVLVGAFDLDRKLAYIVDTIPSPADSVEWPFVYIRGYKGLERDISAIEAVTAGQLHYIGEWHSHPDGYGYAPSSDDAKAFLWLTEIMDADGLPALMLIVGEGGVAPYLGQMVAGQEPLDHLAQG